MRKSETGRVKPLVAGLAIVLTPLAAVGGSGTTAPALVGPVAQTAAVLVASEQTSRSAARGPVPQGVEPHTLLVALPGARDRRARVTSPKGTRLWEVSALGDNGLPLAAERAYRRASTRMAEDDPGCMLPWTLLAGIGRVESDHGRYDGARLGADGVSRPRIIGLRLDGTGPVAAIRDTDDGRLDGDEVWDRAVGPMQFIPSTWDLAARDGDGDGRRSPHDLDDAAAAAAAYLCSGSGSLLDPSTRAAAVYRYNQDDYYVALVLAFEAGYRTGVFVIPPPPTAEDERDGHRKKRRHRAKEAPAKGGSSGPAKSGAASDPAPSPTVSGSGTSSPKPSPSPSPKPSPKPSPSPSPSPTPTQVKAQLTVCDGGYCLGGDLLDLGVVGQVDAVAVGDFDGDGTVESNGAELEGMVGLEVTMVVVALDGGVLGIYSINGIGLS